jgi:hypothetical protein
VSIRVFVVSVFLFVVATAAQAVDLSGQWVGTSRTSTVYCEPPPTSTGPAELQIVQAGNAISGTFTWTFLNPLTCHPTTEEATPTLELTGVVDGNFFDAEVPLEEVVGGRAFIAGSISGNVISLTLIFPVSTDHDNEDDAIDTIVTAQLTRVAPPSASIDSLWPPNHKMVDIGLTMDATSTFIVYSDEDDAGEPDASGSLLLRAERAGTGDGRVYLIAVTAADGVTNTCFTVVVPKSQSERDLESVNAQAAAAMTQCPSPAGYFVIGN